MESTRHFKPPWILIRENSECYDVVRDANGVTVAWLFCRDDSQRYSVGASKLTSDEARRIGKAISRLPEFMTQRQGFHQRGGGPRWRADRPYHVALEDTYIPYAIFARPLPSANDPVARPAALCASRARENSERG